MKHNNLCNQRLPTLYGNYKLILQNNNTTVSAKATLNKNCTVIILSQQVLLGTARLHLSSNRNMFLDLRVLDKWLPEHREPTPSQPSRHKGTAIQSTSRLLSTEICATCIQIHLFTGQSWSLIWSLVTNLTELLWRCLFFSFSSAAR